MSIIIYKLRKWCFNVAIATLSYFSVMLKIKLKYYLFLLKHMFFIIFIIYKYQLYISINFLIHGYIFYLLSKNMLIILTY